MKKIVSLILALAMMMSLSTVAFADSLSEPGTKNTEVKYTVQGGYTVVIPTQLVADATVNENNLTFEGKLDSGKTLTITVNKVTSAMTLGSAKIAYKLMNGDADATTTLLTVEAGTTAAGAKISAKVTDNYENATEAGTYTDTLTFTVTVTP